MFLILIPPIANTEESPTNFLKVSCIKPLFFDIVPVQLPVYLKDRGELSDDDLRNINNELILGTKNNPNILKCDLSINNNNRREMTLKSFIMPSSVDCKRVVNGHYVELKMNESVIIKGYMGESCENSFDSIRIGESGMAQICVNRKCVDWYLTEKSLYEPYSILGVPDKKMVMEWWEKSHPEEPITIAGDMKEVKLIDHETAYICPIYVNKAGRNFYDQFLFVRPKLKEAQIIGTPIRRDLEVMDLNRDNISEIIGVSLGSGQGSTLGDKYVLHFDGWNSIILHKQSFEEHQATDEFSNNDVDWIFKDLDGDGGLDLIEVITNTTGSNPGTYISNLATNKYLFKNNKFAKTN